MAITRLGLSGYGERRAGSFAGKSVPPTHPVGLITRLTLDGYMGGRAGDFSGKITFVEVPEEEERESSGHYIPARRLYIRPRREFDRRERLWIEEVLAQIDGFIPEEAPVEEVELVVRLRLEYEFEAIPVTEPKAKIEAAVEEVLAFRAMPAIVPVLGKRDLAFDRAAIERKKFQLGVDDEEFIELLMLYEMSEED